MQSTPPIHYRLLAAAGALLDPLVGLAAALSPRAFGRPGDQRWASRRRRQRGLALVLSGIEGPSFATRGLVTGLLARRWPGAVEVYRWSDGPPLLRVLINLMHHARNERHAVALAERIRQYRRTHPGRPIILLAQSGGCWIAVRALEHLASEIPSPHRTPTVVDRVALISPAISRRHDLTRAVTACHADFVVTRGCGDWLFLGLAVTVLGNCDRRHGPAGGWLGWPPPLHPRLHELPWRPEFIRLGYLGNHTTAGAPRFIAREIAPRLCPERRPRPDQAADRSHGPNAAPAAPYA